jgi:transcription antitermination factor NusA-like protein
VFDGLIMVKKVVRIPGEKAKVAVDSYDDRIDPAFVWYERTHSWNRS